MNDPGPVVLVVDDEPDVRRFIGHCLRLAGYRVLEAGGRDEAVRWGAGRERIALLVCDVNLPGERGQHVAEAIAALQPGIRTLFVSGLPCEDAGESSLLPTSCSYLPKPFSLAALLEKAAELLHAAPAVAS
jgi:two-component system, cell cycle sensor histidine kinase and response regulator CckA